MFEIQAQTVSFQSILGQFEKASTFTVPRCANHVSRKQSKETNEEEEKKKRERESNNKFRNCENVTCIETVKAVKVCEKRFLVLL